MSLWSGLRAQCMCDAGRVEPLTHDVAINVALVGIIFHSVFDPIRDRGASIYQLFGVLWNRPGKSFGPARHDHDTRKDYQRRRNCVPA